MSWRTVSAVCLAVCLTAGAFELSTRCLLVKRTWCDSWRGTWLGMFCRTDNAGGGDSGAR